MSPQEHWLPFPEPPSYHSRHAGLVSGPSTSGFSASLAKGPCTPATSCPKACRRLCAKCDSLRPMCQQETPSPHAWPAEASGSPGGIYGLLSRSRVLCVQHPSIKGQPGPWWRPGSDRQLPPQALWMAKGTHRSAVTGMRHRVCSQSLFSWENLPRPGIIKVTRLAHGGWYPYTLVSSVSAVPAATSFAAENPAAHRA